MAMNGKVRPDCNYASNPYHECTETCLKRIAEGKGRKDKKKSDGGVVYNKKYEEKRGNRTCHRASNPYHECSESCFKDAGAGREVYKTPGPVNGVRSEGRKSNDARSAPSREIENVRSSVSVPLARFLLSDKTESQNGERYSSSDEIQVEDLSPKPRQVHSSLSLPASGIISKPDHSRDIPKESVKKQNENNNVGSGSPTFSFSGVIAQSNEGSDDDDTQSVNSDSSVSVGKYRVKGRLSPILQSIFDKYGDIGASCQLESIAMRSYYLECVCFVVQELQITQIKNVTKSKIKEMLAILKDVEASGINVGWLRRVLIENSEALEKVGQHRAIEESIANCNKDIESARKKLVSQMEGLSLKEKEIEDGKKKIEETKTYLKELELKCSVLVETVNSIKSKVENGKSLLDGVL